MASQKGEFWTFEQRKQYLEDLDRVLVGYWRALGNNPSSWGYLLENEDGN